MSRSGRVSREWKSRSGSVFSTGVVPTTWGISNNVFFIPRGVGDDERIGDSVDLKKIAIRGRLCLKDSAFASQTADTVRFCMILDKQANGAIPLALDVFEENTVFTWMNSDNGRRFEVLLNKFIDLNGQSGGGDGAGYFGKYRKVVEYYRDLDVKIEYDDPNPTIADLLVNNIYFCIICSETNLVEACLYYKYWYTDH